MGVDHDRGPDVGAEFYFHRADGRRIKRAVASLLHINKFERIDIRVAYQDIGSPTARTIVADTDEISGAIDSILDLLTQIGRITIGCIQGPVASAIHGKFNVVNLDCFERITDHIIRRYFEDLDTYYKATIQDSQNNEFLAKDIMRTELAKVLYKHRKKKILLIAHSMGSIIAYDVLTQMVPYIEIDTLVTIGSPLGIPIIIRKILAEQKDSTLKDKPKTPDNIVNAWYNFSDLKDKVVLDYTLANDYEKNPRGVGAIDKVVFNNYEIASERNPHKSYGYLRTPELAEVIHRFLKG